MVMIPSAPVKFVGVIATPAGMVPTGKMVELVELNREDILLIAEEMKNNMIVAWERAQATVEPGEQPPLLKTETLEISRDNLTLKEHILLVLDLANKPLSANEIFKIVGEFVPDLKMKSMMSKVSILNNVDKHIISLGTEPPYEYMLTETGKDLAVQVGRRIVGEHFRKYENERQLDK